MNDEGLLDAIRAAAAPPSDSGALLARIGEARLVLIGEATHGTQEFYQERAKLTKQLIEQRGFTAVAVEADWPDAQRVNRFVRGEGHDPGAEAALGDFTRFPRWMWRNTVVQDFVGWLRGHNAGQAGAPVGFYGLDLYSLQRSMRAVIAYLDAHDPEAAGRARARYSCFDRFEPEQQRYGPRTAWGLEEPYEDAVVQQLLELQRRPDEAAPGDPDARFFAEQNARLALNAEAYARAMFQGGSAAWNRRDTHMADTVDALSAHLQGQGRAAKLVVWAHNSHLGDARAGEPGWRRGQLNLGQLLRERHPGQTFILGQSTFTGEVTAADGWEAPPRRRVRPALPESVEALLHAAGIGHSWLDLGRPELAGLAAERLQRFIGVIYVPQSERVSHYLLSRPGQQYDALLAFDRTAALTPLDTSSGWAEGELPETFPSELCFQ